MTTGTDADSTIRQIEFELEKAEHGMALPYDAERVRDLRKMLLEARKRKLSDGLARGEERDGRPKGKRDDFDADPHCRCGGRPSDICLVVHCYQFERAANELGCLCRVWRRCCSTHNSSPQSRLRSTRRRINRNDGRTVRDSNRRYAAHLPRIGRITRARPREMKEMK